MKKVIFLAIAAAAALTACSKSEVIDSKYGNDMIGFENYLGRDAQTKAGITTTDNLASLGLFGYYTGAETWENGEFVANLWDGVELTKTNNWVPATPKYWTNDTDKYTFLAYAPYSDAAIEVTTGRTPAVEYTVNPELSKQIDLLYANAEDHVNMVKPENNTVTLKFNHALSRLTVKASATGEAFKFDVKEVFIEGKFNTTDVLTLATGTWGKQGAVATADAKYTFHTKETGKDADNNPIYSAYKETNALTSTPVDYSGTTYNAEGAVEAYGNNYLMMIPTNFSGEGNAAKLTVKYTTYYMDKESNVNTATFDVPTDFVQGKAYVINLVFTKDLDVIKFAVDVADWDENTTAQNEYPADKPEENGTEEPAQGA